MPCIAVRRIAVRIAILLIALLAISCGYQPGSFSARGQPFGSSRTTIGCLDIGIERIDATELEDTAPTGPAVSFTIANRCDHPAVVDFTQIVVSTTDGQPFVAFDPRREIHRAILGARKIAVETIEFHPTPSSPISPKNVLDPLTAICVDVSAITDGVRSGTAAPGSTPILCPPPPSLARNGVTNVTTVEGGN